MQDTLTGDLVELSNYTQEARDFALPRERQGAVLQVGEEVNIKGGRFVINSIGKTMVVLRSLPGTDVVTAE